MTTHHNVQDHVINAVKDAPPVAVGSVVFFGVELSDWVLILTAIYTIIRIASELRMWYDRKRNDRNSTVLDSRSSDNPHK